jgi:hypothetical protein
MRIRELENENSNLLTMLNKHNIKSPSSSFVNEKSQDSIPKITSAKNARSFAINLDPEAPQNAKDDSVHNISLVIEKKKDKDLPSSHSKTKTPSLKLKKKTVDVDSKPKEKSSSKRNVGEHDSSTSSAKAHLKHMFTELSAIVKGVAK